MQTKTRHEIDMVHGPVLPGLFAFAIPMALSSLLQLAFNAADVIVLGRFAGANELAGMGSTISLTNLLVGFFVNMSVGVNVVVSADYAAGDFERVSKTVHTAIAFALSAGLFLVIAGNLASRPLLVAMGDPPEVLPYAVTYMRIYFGAMPFLLVYNFGAAVLRSVGDTKRPFYYLLLVGVINVILNLFFVIALGMGTAGVAIATDISSGISAFLVVRALWKEDSCLKLDPKKLGFDREILAKIAKIGIPCGLQSMLFNICNVMIQSTVNSFGAATIAGNTAAINLENFYGAALSAVSASVVSFISASRGGSACIPGFGGSSFVPWAVTWPFVPCLPLCFFCSADSSSPFIPPTRR